MPSFLAYRLGLMSHLGSTFSKIDGRDKPKMSKMVRNRSPWLRLAHFQHHPKRTGPRMPLECPPDPKTIKNMDVGVWGPLFC